MKDILLTIQNATSRYRTLRRWHKNMSIEEEPDPEYEEFLRIEREEADWIMAQLEEE